VRLIIARCSVTYTGRLTTRLPEAVRTILIKADGATLIHGDAGSKPLNYMPGPTLIVDTGGGLLVQQKKTGETLTIDVAEVLHDLAHDLGAEPGLVKDGDEKQLQALLEDRLDVFGDGFVLVRREYPTPLGPVDFLCRDANGKHVAVEIKRNGGIDGVEQLTRYLDMLSRDPLLAPVRGVFAAQAIAPQARVLAADRGIECRTFDLDALRGIEGATPALF
jgi:RecB family endonuclease NucS